MKNWQVILQSNLFLVLIICLLILRLGLAFNSNNKSIYQNNETNFEGEILSYKFNGDNLTLTIKKKEKLVVYYKIKSEKEKEELEEKIGYKTYIKIMGNLKLPKENTIPNTFNYKKYLYYQHIYYTCEANNIEIKKNPSFLYQLKNKMVKKLKKMNKKEYFLAFLIGDTSYLDTEILRKNGISHLFAVSGMHFSFLVVILKKCFKKNNWIHQSILILFQLFYAFLCNFTPSVLRVLILYFIKLPNTYWKLSNKKMLFFCFSILLMYNPFFIMNIGFQYSFMISFCLSFLTIEKNKILKTSFIAFLCSLPISAIHFFEINILSIFFNILLIPAVTFIIYPITFLSLIFPLVRPIYESIITIFEQINNCFVLFSFGRIIIPKVSLIFWIIYYGLLFLFLQKERKRYLLFLIVFIFIMKLIPKIDSASTVYFLDVGQGDATLFISPYQKEIMLIDTGGIHTFQKEDWQKKKNTSTKSTELVTFFHSLGLTKIHNLIISHGDIDHGGNAKDILASIKVDNICLNQNEDTFIEKEIRKMYPEKIKENIESREYQIKNYSQKEEKDENDASLILRIKTKGVSFLMMADASKKVEEKINVEKSDILKIGHHGSNTSSSYSFLKKVNPKYAIISVGENNKYNHPSKETINSLNNLNIHYFETRKSGTIIVKIKKELQILTVL